MVVEVVTAANAAVVDGDVYSVDFSSCDRGGVAPTTTSSITYYRQ